MSASGAAAVAVRVAAHRPAVTVTATAAAAAVAAAAADMGGAPAAHWPRGARRRDLVGDAIGGRGTPPLGVGQAAGTAISGSGCEAAETVGGTGTGTGTETETATAAATMTAIATAAAATVTVARAIAGATVMTTPVVAVVVPRGSALARCLPLPPVTAGRRCRRGVRTRSAATTVATLAHALTAAPMAKALPLLAATVAAVSRRTAHALPSFPRTPGCHCLPPARSVPWAPSSAAPPARATPSR